LIKPLFALNLISNRPSSSHSPTHSIDEKIPESIESYYSTRIYKPLLKWPPSQIPDISTIKGPFWVNGIKHPEKGTYIGMAKRMLIHVPLDKASALIEDFEGTPALLRDMKEVKVVSKDKNKLHVSWRRESPSIFVGEIEYTTFNLIDKNADRAIYRSQLEKSNSANSSDGIIILEKHKGGTLFTAFDFFDANWGILGALALGRIWRECVTRAILVDMKFKVRLEHPDWKIEQVEKEAEKILEEFPIEEVEFINFEF
jgi:uncharacterized membrane protein